MIQKAVLSLLSKKPAFLVSLAYLTFGALWILYSELILSVAVSDPALRSMYSIWGGFAIILITAVFLFFLMRIIINELKHKEDSITVTQSNFRAILDSTIQCYILLDINDKSIIDFNKLADEYWKQNLNLKLQKGKSIEAFLPEDNIPNFRKSFEIAAQGTELKKMLHYAIPDSSKKGYYEIVYKPVIDHKGKVLNVFFSITDITEQTISSEKLRVSESRYRLMAEYSTDAILRMDSEGEIIFASPAIYELTGNEPNEVTGKSFYQFLPDYELRKVKDFFVSVNEGSASSYQEFKMYNHAEQKTVWVEASAKKILESEVPDYEIIVVVRDVSERKKAELELSAQKYAMDQASIVSITDPSGVITHVNKRFCEVAGYSEDQLVGKSHRVIKSDHHDEMFFKNMWNTIMKGNIWKGEIRNKSADGSLFWVDTTVVPFLDDEQKPYQFLAICFDITERKEVEQAMRRLNLELEQRVKKRTQELEETNLELESFSSAVSHDLRNPINLIKNFSQLLLKKNKEHLDDKSEEYIHEIINQSERMSDLIRDLLQLSKITRQELVSEEVNLSRIVSDMMEFYQTQYKDKHYEIEVQPDIYIQGDGRLLKIALENLINNAFKYASHKKEPEISFGMEMVEGKRTLFLKDNGAGFEPEFADRIFEPFERLHAQHEFKGTGVGLATVSRIINKHGGNIWAMGEKGVGATFYFYLPGLGKTPAQRSTSDVTVS